jgi:hypothetical protein
MVSRKLQFIEEDKNLGQSYISVLITRRTLDILQKSSYMGKCEEPVIEVK